MKIYERSPHIWCFFMGTERGVRVSGHTSRDSLHDGASVVLTYSHSYIADTHLLDLCRRAITVTSVLGEVGVSIVLREEGAFYIFPPLHGSYIHSRSSIVVRGEQICECESMRKDKLQLPSPLGHEQNKQTAQQERAPRKSGN